MASTESMQAQDVAAGELDEARMAEVSAMIEAGVFYGRVKSKTHPAMKQFVFTNRGGVDIIDLSLTLGALDRSLEFLREIVKSGGLLLFVATQPAASGLIALAKEFGYPYVEKRWIGGTLTNFATIGKRVAHMQELRRERDTGGLSKFKKKERIEIEKEIEKLQGMLGGIEALPRLPNAIITIHPGVHTTAIREARRLNIPVVAFGSTDTDPDHADYLVPGNSMARRSIDWLIEKLRAAIGEAKSAAPSAVAHNAEGAPAAHAEERIAGARKDGDE